MELSKALKLPCRWRKVEPRLVEETALKAGKEGEDPGTGRNVKIRV
jgi:hypothetical protein